MRVDNHSLRGPITFLSEVLLLEGILLCVVLSTIQIVTLILLWFAFRLLIRVNDRPELSWKKTKNEINSNESFDRTKMSCAHFVR
ncbi:MAG TPA: hypothetical protein DEW46_07770 [Verrucomicrobia bacterium]|jgi:hypothetical protein|nr:hypothetical protein [Verrucomicrobiota bacterium]